MRARDELSDQTREEASRGPQAGPGENGRIEDERCDCPGPVTINGGMCGSKFCVNGGGGEEDAGRRVKWARAVLSGCVMLRACDSVAQSR
jgi:hypothetical protein